MVQDLYRLLGGRRMPSVPPRHVDYFPLKDQGALEALEVDLMNDLDLRRELVRCF